MKEIILPQIVSIGIYNAQVALKNKSVSKNRKTTMFELELPIETGGISYIDDEAHSISKKLVICAKPGQIRHTRLPFKCYYIHLIANKGSLFDILSSFPNYIELSESEPIKKIFLSLCEYGNTEFPEDDIIIQSLVLKLIYTLNKNAFAVSKHTPKSANNTVIEQTLSYIDNNLTSKLTLETLSNEAKFTPVYFHKLFKSSTGETLHEYIEKRRIKKSVNLLLSTDKTLTQIAYECGFSSQSYFSYAFKRRMGISPRAYVEQLITRYNV